MELISWPFFVFLIIVLVIYYLLPGRYQNYWILLTSLGFCASLGWDFCLILIITILINYILGKAIFHGEKYRLFFLIFGIVLNLSAFLYFKMGNNGYLVRLINYLLRTAGETNQINVKILIPIGFSFYILQAISYLIDIYKKQTSPAGILPFSIYMSYFPRLVSGPIERAKTFIPQLEKPKNLDNDRLRRSVFLICLGLFRKLILSYEVSKVIPEFIFTNPAKYAPVELIFGLFFYSFWVYNDFAGYSDLVRGISKLFGIEIMANFRQPFFAVSFADFWNRWHISLSHWLRDYIFLPLRRKMLRIKVFSNSILNVFLPPVLTMIVSGLWHNFGVYMIVWGTIQGLYQAVERFIFLPSGKEKTPKNKSRYVFQSICVFFFFMLTWIPFGSGGFLKMENFVRSLFKFQPAPDYFFLLIFPSLIFCIICLLIDWFINRYNNDEMAFFSLKPTVQSLIVALFLFFLVINSLWAEESVTPFVYQGF